MEPRKNELICCVRWELDESGSLVIENEDFEAHVEATLAKGSELRFTFIHRKTGFANSIVDEIANQFVKDCRNGDPKRYRPYMPKKGYEGFGKVFLAFLSNLFRCLIERGKTVFALEEGDFTTFDVFPANRNGYFVVRIPNSLWNKSREKEFIALGPDNVFAVFSWQVIFDYILPDYYIFLFETNRLGQLTPETNLLRYMAGLH